MRGIARDCIVEMFDRKTIYLFLFVTVLALLSYHFLGGPNTEISIQTEGMEQNPFLDWVTNPGLKVADTFLSFMVFLVLLATAGLIPNMFSRGRAEFYLSKPISRSSLLFNKLMGMWLVYGMTIAVLAALVYGVFGYLNGGFDWHVMVYFAFHLFNLFVWLSILVAAGVITGSTTLTLMSMFLLWVAQSVIQYHEEIAAFINSKPITFLLNTLYYILPKNGEMSKLTTDLAFGRGVDTWMPFYSTFLFALFCLVVGFRVFKRKSY